MERGRVLEEDTMPGFGMTDLDERLCAKGGGDLRKQIANDLAKKASLIELKMKNGLNREEFQQAKVIHKALVAACDVISRY
ncbi:hypothetical protein FIV00_26195 [Labrenzia sp. THAF82]|uniref:EscE/YscE/SsaE family type III secretion system needle protein co-chaperone n=1 Tax=Labrenzia sp. THAF82 TaxID=2587861 RepID=UPI0012A7B3CF|nr:hypothetical protein [Labrenzia sp. THAF82]QFT34015.1 hypothetical protein FIV00_26195 [Labrenzia sp. THAF82]